MEPIHDLLPYLCAEQSTRWANGDHVPIEDFISQFQELKEDTSSPVSYTHLTLPTKA